MSSTRLRPEGGAGAPSDHPWQLYNVVLSCDKSAPDLNIVARFLFQSYQIGGLIIISLRRFIYIMYVYFHEPEDDPVMCLEYVCAWI